MPPDSNPRLSAALSYADRGWRVFPLYEISPDNRCSCGHPCESPGKHPRTPHGLVDATTDWDRIAAWWSDWPNANVGIATGAESNLVVVDIDPRHQGDETLRQLELRIGALNPALVANTGGGGWHYLFAHPGEKVRNRAPLPGHPGLDFKGDGGYVVAPPSNHYLGGSYSWASEHHASPGLLPAAILDLANQGPEARRLSYEFKDWNGKLPARVGQILHESSRLADRLLSRSAAGLDDPTPSGVDFSIATLLAQEGFTGAEIEAAIHWSRENAGERAKGESYYRATVEKALGAVVERGSIEDDGVCIPSRVDRYIAFINGRPDHRASYEQLKSKFNVSDRTLRRDLAAEESVSKRLRRFKDGHQWYLTVRRGSGLKAIPWDAPVAHEMREAAHLPPGFRRFIGSETGLPPNTFVLYQAFGDGFKTSFLINTAIENAKAGLRVVFVSHENNVDTFRQLIARRILGQAAESSEEARRVCSQTDWMQRLELKVADGSVHVDEFIDQLAEGRPDVVVYDYLNQSLMTVDKADQQSSLANIVQRLGNGLVDRGIPLFTAVQLSRDKGQPYAPETWQQRATVVLRADVPVAEEESGNTVVGLKILKNKAGYDGSRTGELQMVVCNLSHQVVRVEVAAKTPGIASEHRSSDDALAMLPDRFSETDLRKVLSKCWRHAKDHPKVRNGAKLALESWGSRGLVIPDGQLWVKVEPEAEAGALMPIEDGRGADLDLPSPPCAPADSSGQAANFGCQADTPLAMVTSTLLGATGEHPPVPRSEV